MNSGVSAYREDAVIRQERAEDRAKASIANVPDPAQVEFVTSGHERLCIDCYWCRDFEHVTPPAFLQCYRPVISASNGGTAPSCVTARSEQFKHLACGHDAVWFEDALDR